MIAKRLLEIDPSTAAAITDDETQAAYSLGALGPDLFYYLQDDRQWLLGNEFVNDVIRCYTVLREVRSFCDELDELLSGPDEAIDAWWDGGAAQQSDALLEEALKALWTSVGLLLATDQSVTIQNPFAALGIPGAPTSPSLTITKPGAYTSWLRTWGHPYTLDAHPSLPGLYKFPAPDPTDPAVANVYERGWWWVDVLHYRRTGQFAARLLSDASDPLTKAYALGYWTHVAGDVCGHPYVNAVVGGPYRDHVIRHLVMENVIDAWLWDEFENENLVGSALHERFDLRTLGIDFEDSFGRLAKHLVTTLKHVYAEPDTGARAINPRAMPGLPRVDDMVRAYDLFLLILENATTAEITAPTAPPGSPQAFFDEMAASMDTSLQAAIASAEQAIGTAPASPWERILAPFLAAAWALVLVYQYVTFGAAAFDRLETLPKRWLIYFLRLALYQYAREVHWMLAQNGLGKVSSDDLGRDFAETCVSLPASRTGANAFAFPLLPVDHEVPGFWLIDPAEFTPPAPPEPPPPGCPGFESCPYPPTSTPDIFITGPPYDSENDERLRGLATATDPLTTEKILQATFGGAQLGNAPELARRFIAGADQYPAADFDLDGDLGYAFRGWEGPLRPPARYRSREGNDL